MSDQAPFWGRMTGKASLVNLILLIGLMAGTPTDAAPAKKREAATRTHVKASEPVSIGTERPLPLDLDAAVTDLELQLSVASDPATVRSALGVALARRASGLAASGASPDKARMLDLLTDFRRARDLAPSHPDVWLAYLTFLLSRPDQAAVAAMEAQDALDKVIPGLARPIPPDWKAIIEKLECLYATHDMPLFRVQCLELLARGGDTGAASASKLLVVARDTAIRRIPEVLSRLDASLSLGDLPQADILLNGLRRLEPSLPALAVFQQRLRTARQVEDLLAAMYRAMRDSRPTLARDLCEQVLRLDANNPQARTVLSRFSMNTVATAAVVVASGEAARKNALIKEFREKLEAALGHDEILAARQILREIDALGAATPAQTSQLQHIEQELLESRFLVSQRFDEAQSLFETRQWEKLRRLLNRNPALGNSTERVIRVWEMGLMADCELGWKDPETLIAEADRLAEKAPKSFWPQYVKLRVALNQGRYADAEPLLTAAQAVEPNSRFLTWPARILWLWRHGWKFAPILILAFIFLLAKSMHAFFAWWERFYWTWISVVARVFPGLALASLEKRFTAAREAEDKLLLYRLLARCAFATGQAAKGIRYAELILEVRGGDPDAVEMLGRQYLKLPSPTPAQFDFVIGYAARRPDDRELTERLGKAVLAGRAVTPEMLPILGRYIGLFPQDDGMTRILGEYYRSADPMALTAEAIDFIEKAWRKSGAEEIWYVLLRALILRGLFDRFEQLVGEAAAAGKAGEWWRLFDLADRQTESELFPIQTALGGMDRQRSTEAMQKALTLRFLTKKRFQPLAAALDGHVMSEEAGVRYLAQKARDYIRSQVMKTEAFVAAMSHLMPSPVAEAMPSEPPEAVGEPSPADMSGNEEPLLPEFESVPGALAALESLEVDTAAEPVQEESGRQELVPAEEAPRTPPPEIQPLVPETAASTDGSDSELFSDLGAAAPSSGRIPDIGPVETAVQEGENGLFGDLPLEPDSSAAGAPGGMALPGLTVEASDAVQTQNPTVGERIRNLPDDPEMSDIRSLIDATTVADIKYWKEYFDRPLPRELLETLPKLLAGLHAAELVPLFAKLLESPLPRVRANAIEALEENGCQAAIPVFISLFRDDDNRVKANAIKAMSAFGADTMLEELRGMIEDPRVEMRDSATYVLRGIRGQESAILLEHLLRDGSALVRFNAIRSMAVQGDRGNTQRLMEYLPEVADPEERDLLFKVLAELQKTS